MKGAEMSQWKRVAISLGLTLAIVLSIILIPSQASALDVTVSGPTSVYKPNQICFDATLTFQNGDIIPISSLEAIITGATAVTIVFDTDGSVASVTGDLNASQIGASITRSEQYGYGYGYRTGYESGYGYHYFGYGYGYYGYGGSNVVSYEICISTLYLTAGNHQIQVKVNAEGDSVTASFTSDAHSFRVNLLTGGGGGAPPARLEFDVNMMSTVTSWSIDDDGVLLENVIVWSEELGVGLFIPQGTQVLDAGGNPLFAIYFDLEPDPIPMLPPYFIYRGYNFTPSGASFHPPAEMTMVYEEEALPAGASEEDLFIAYYDDELAEYVELFSEVNTEANEVTAEVSHFTLFVLAGVVTPPELTGEGIVAPEGGAVTTTDGRVTLQFAEGAFTADAVVTIEPIACGAAPEGFRIGDTCFRIQATVDSGSVSVLGAAMTICVEYSDADLAIAGGDLNLLSLTYYDATAGEYVVLDSTVDDGTICATTNHLSDWAVVAEVVEVVPTGLQWWHILLVVLSGLALIGAVIWLATMRPRPTQA